MLACGGEKKRYMKQRVVAPSLYDDFTAYGVTVLQKKH